MLRKTLICFSILILLGFVSMLATQCSQKPIGGRFQIYPQFVEEHSSELPQEAVLTDIIQDTLSKLALPAKPNGYNGVSEKELGLFYSNRSFRPAWFNETEDYNMLYQLDAEIFLAAQEAIDTNYYKLIVSHFRSLADHDSLSPEAGLAIIDIGTSYLYLTLSKHLLLGQYDYDGAQRSWHSLEKEKFNKLLEGETPTNLHEFFIGLKPQTEQYKALAKEYVKWHNTADSGWYPLKIKDKLKSGDSTEVIAEIKRRLYLLGYLDTPDRSGLYDAKTANAMSVFQQDHGLLGDSIIGESTMWALNLLPGERAQIISTNLDRLRWGPRNYGSNYFLVNIPEFKLHYYEGNEPEFDMAVVVGKTYHKTPVFSDSMEYIIFNPTWSVPPGITRNEVLPAMRKNPDYARRENMVVYEGHGPNARQVDPSEVNWEEAGNNYKFVQRPGNYNALGRVKFIFPNSKNVYLHDTPSQHLFSRESRAFSHGCIRVSQPEFMAWYLLQDTLSREEVRDLMTGPPRGRTYHLKKKIPVHIVYQTAAVREGRLYFFRDVYGYDEKCNAWAEELVCRL